MIACGFVVDAGSKVGPGGGSRGKWCSLSFQSTAVVFVFVVVRGERGSGGGGKEGKVERVELEEDGRVVRSGKMGDRWGRREKRGRESWKWGRREEGEGGRGRG